MDPVRFPDFPALVKQIHDEGLKVILWATSMVNTENPDYDFAVKNKYLVRDSRGFVRPLKWWHGSGGLLDYSNPEAVAWWHSLMDRVLDAGVDGFKCDGTDPYIIEYSLTGGALGYQDKVITYPEYAHMYYRDFFYYTREKRAADGPDAGLIMSRPVDCNLDDVTKLCTPFSPKDVMLSGWVGDDDATFRGMEGCLRKTIYSAWMNYANFGCDIGGYRGKDSTFSKTLFVRWTQLGSFMSLMENGGGGEHRPWMYDEETVNIYRHFTVQHHRLAPYMHTMGANALSTGTSSMHPVDEQVIDANTTTIGRKDFKIVFPQPRSYSYRLGDDILVHPVVFHFENKTDAATVHMSFPDEKDGSTAVWLDWWRPNDEDKTHKSGDKKFREVPLNSYAVYVREGALMPLYAASVDPNGVDRVDLNRVMFTWFHPAASKATESNRKRFDMRESISTGEGLRAEGYYTADGVLVGEVSARDIAGGFEFVGVEKPSNVEIEAWEGSPCVDLYNPVTKTLQVSCRNLRGGMRVKVTA
eukprot:gene18319-13165_t